LIQIDPVEKLSTLNYKWVTEPALMPKAKNKTSGAKKLKTKLYRDSQGKVHKHIFKLQPPKKNHAFDWAKKIIDRKKVKLLAKKLRAKKEIVVFTPGGFDMIHVGHSRFLALAKSLGTILVVGINSDNSIRAYKGDDRPILSQDRRAEMLAHLAAVDYVVIFDDTMATLGKIKHKAEELAKLAVEDGFKGEFFSTGVIRDLRPDRLLCIEETWEGRLHERPEVLAVLAYGGEVFCSPRQDPELSTSKIITKLMDDGKRDLVKQISAALNQETSLKGSL
jgi:rfaE bifunctional protein nucleotidyltransferase chain/domain